VSGIAGVADPLYRALRALLFTCPPERSHALAGAALTTAAAIPGVRGAIRRINTVKASGLETEVFGVKFANPVGLAAGWDKDGRYVRGLSLLGFGFGELGTVTPRAQPGNPHPRLFRIPEQQALINRMGFNNRGAGAMRERLARYVGTDHRPPIGINLGKNLDTPLDKADHDYLACLEALHPVADYVVLNVSSLNTPGLRDLQAPPMLKHLLGRVVPRARAMDEAAGRGPTPVLVKLSPDERPEVLPDIVEAARQAGIDGFVATNTTSSRSALPPRWLDEEGGLSGVPLCESSRETISAIWRHTGGELPIIGVGGIAGAEDAWRHIRAGASLVQLYTALIYQGPRVVRRICEGLLERIDRAGFSSISEAVGADHR
jgi:dihydroorotate dehydrogenase